MALQAQRSAARITVLDLGLGKSAALASRLFEDLGARVIRVESPSVENCPACAVWRRNNLVAAPEQLDEILPLADVCLVGGEGVPTGNSLLAIEEIRERAPTAIVLTMSGYGIADFDKTHPAIDLLVQARSGIVWEQEEARPIALGYALPTYGMVLQGVLGVWCALILRLSDLRGRVVKTSLLQGGAMYWAPFWLVAEKSS